MNPKLIEKHAIFVPGSTASSKANIKAYARSVIGTELLEVMPTDTWFLIKLEERAIPPSENRRGKDPYWNCKKHAFKLLVYDLSSQEGTEACHVCGERHEMVITPFPMEEDICPYRTRTRIQELLGRLSAMLPQRADEQE